METLKCKGLARFRQPHKKKFNYILILTNIAIIRHFEFYGSSTRELQV